MWETLSRSGLDRDWRFHVHVERFDIKELANKSDPELAAWLENRWMEKSKHLARLQQALTRRESWSQDTGADGKKAD